MRYAVQFKHYGIGDMLPDYWQMIKAETEAEARKIAKKQAKKDYTPSTPVLDIFTKPRVAP